MHIFCKYFRFWKKKCLKWKFACAVIIISAVILSKFNHAAIIRPFSQRSRLIGSTSPLSCYTKEIFCNFWGGIIQCTCQQQVSQPQQQLPCEEKQLKIPSATKNRRREGLNHTIHLSITGPNDKQRHFCTALFYSSSAHSSKLWLEEMPAGWGCTSKCIYSNQLLSQHKTFRPTLRFRIYILPKIPTEIQSFFFLPEIPLWLIPLLLTRTLISHTYMHAFGGTLRLW